MTADDSRARIDPERYYDEFGHDEWDRLERTVKSAFEFSNTTEYLERYLPAEDHILDAGGAAGRYAVWLAERERAVRELRRVTNPDSPVFVSVMGFVALVQNLIKVAPEFPQGVAQLPDLVETGTYSPELIEEHGIEEPSFVECHFFRADELEAALERNGFAVDVVAGLEGPASNFDAEIDAADPDQQDRIEAVVRNLREDRTIADVSNHILAVARAG